MRERVKYFGNVFLIVFFLLSDQLSKKNMALNERRSTKKKKKGEEEEKEEEEEETKGSPFCFPRAAARRQKANATSDARQLGKAKLGTSLDLVFDFRHC